MKSVEHGGMSQVSDPPGRDLERVGLLEPAPPSLAISLLGPFSLELSGVPLPRLRSRKQEAILALLALRHDRPVERAWLAGLLWPDSSTSQGLATLRRYLTTLRQLLGPEASRLRSPTASSLMLDLAGARVDLIVFEMAMARRDLRSLEEAVSLYRGALLEGWTEEWVFQERQPREQAYLEALERLAAAARASGDLRTAERHLRRAIVVDPLRESAQRALMEALAASGHYAGVIQSYRELRQRLHRDLNAAPDPETQQLFQRLREEARSRADALVVAARGDGRREAGAQIYQIVHPDLPSQFPPLVSLSRRLHNLLAQPTVPLGRDRQVAELVERLQREEIRLLTLTGPGGVGKSRLQLQVAAELLDQYPDGIWRADLASLTDPSLVLPTVTTALGLHEQPDRPLLTLLTDWLRQRLLLLVLDNCEPVVQACSQLISTLLRASPGLCILASSRQALGVTGEVRWRVPSLETPDPRTLAPARAGAAVAVGHSPAVQLFVERATAIQPSFALTDQNALAVAQVCHRLDGIPGMIELAAARVDVLSVEQIAARMDDFFRLLTGGGRAALRAGIESSYTSLSEPERVLMRRLSVLAGGWSLEAAQAVCSDFGFWISDFGLPASSDPSQNPKSEIQNEEVVDLLTLLVEKSLVLSDDPGTAVRFRLPGAVRQDSRARLLESGEAAAVQDRHRDYFLQLVERFEPETYGCNGPGWQDRLEAHGDNLRVALDWVVQHQEMPTGLGWGPVLAQFWRLRGPASEGLRWLKQILALPCAQEPSKARAHTLMRMGDLARQQAGYALARALYEESLALYRALGEQGRVMACCALLAMVARDSGDYPRARSLYGEIAAAAPEAGEDGIGCPALEATARTAGKERGSWLSTSLYGRGNVAYLEGDLDTAQALLEESLRLYREQGHGHAGHVGRILTHLAEVADRRGDYQTAEQHLTETLNLWHKTQEQEDIAFLLRRLGRVRHHQGDLEAACAHFTEALALLREHGNRQAIAESLEGLAGVATGQGRPAHATHLIAAAELQRELIGAPLPPVERAEHDRRMATVRAQLGEGAFAAAWAWGRSISLRHAIAEALGEAPAG